MTNNTEIYEMLWDFANEAISLSSSLMFGIEDDAEHYQAEKNRLYNELISYGFSKVELDRLADICDDIGEYVIPAPDALRTEIRNIYYNRVTGDLIGNDMV